MLASCREPYGITRFKSGTDDWEAPWPSARATVEGYTGVAAVDARRLIIVEAQALGTGSEQKLPLPMSKADTKTTRRRP